MTETSGSFDIPAQARDRFDNLINVAGQGLEEFYIGQRERLIAQSRAATRKNGMLAPIKVFNQAINSYTTETERVAFRRALLARFALDLPKTAAAARRPPSVLELYPDLAERLSHSIATDDGEYDTDDYGRDIGHVTGLFLPAAAQDIDLNGSLRVRMFLAAALKQGHVGKLGRYLTAGFWRRCFDIHTDSRHTAMFNPKGWDHTYLCAADLMKQDPSVPAMFGTSWFYDPALRDISPRLAYLQDIPCAAGAFLIRNGPGEIHTQRATLTSKTRKTLFEEGKYLPVCYTLIWPRRALIAWARTNRHGRE